MNFDKPCSRKNFFSALARQAGELAVGLADGASEAARAFHGETRPEPETKPIAWVRPPGALAETGFLAACTRCDDCIKACPHLVIRKAGPEVGKGVATTPVIVPGDNSCRFCEGFPCIKACESGALLMPKPDTKVRIGTARIREAECYSVQNQPCDYCQTYCPEVEKAIVVARPGTAPAVNAELCTGCGQCAEICPTGCITVERLS